MLRIAIFSFFILTSLAQADAGPKMMDFLLSFNNQSSSCDRLEVEKTYSDDEKIIRLTLHDLQELGDEEVVSGIEFKKFEFEDKYTAKAERYGRYQGKRVKEVFTFIKDENGNFKTVSLIRYKRKLLRYGYSLGGIVCRR